MKKIFFAIIIFVTFNGCMSAQPWGRSNPGGGNHSNHGGGNYSGYGGGHSGGCH